LVQSRVEKLHRSWTKSTCHHRHAVPSPISIRH
jgi:hypothetical protein